MRLFFRILGFIFSWIIPFGVVYINHVILTETKIDVDMFGLLIVIALLFGLIKRIDKKIELWEIHKEHSIFILNWRNGKKVVLMSLLTWVLFTIEDDLGKMQLSAVLILLSFLIGWFFYLIGNKKRVTQNE